MGDDMLTRSKTGKELERKLRQACDTLESRLRAGQSYRTEDCLVAYPELAADSDSTLEILYFEYVMREEMGEALSAEEWYRRFPEQQIPLRKILQIHHGAGSRSNSGGLSASLETLTPEQSAAQRRALVQRRLSKYEILEELGRGSMGVVYKAREPALDRMVALKVILAGPHAGLDQLIRIRREARAIARLQHPNIVQIHEIGDDDGRPFLCMEYVDGPGLDRLLSRWNEQGSLGLTPRAAAGLVASLADAVHYAHQQGIIHRDLKPANILLQRKSGIRNPEGKSESRNPKSEKEITNGVSDLEFRISDFTPKIADFGLAKFLDSSAEATQTGHLIGTPSFMAPEQAEGRTDDVGPAVDLYALGVILYQLLTGRPPFQAASVQETLELVRTAEPPPPRHLQPNLPRDLQTICLKCLAKEPGSRYASALDLAKDLRRFLAGEPVRARPATVTDRVNKWVKRRPVVAGLLAALLLAIAGGGTGIVWQWWRAEQNARYADRIAQNFKNERDKAVEERRRAERHLKRARESIDELAMLSDKLWLNPQMNKTGRTLLEKVLTFYQAVLKDESQDPVVRLRTAQVYGKVAYFRHTVGQWDKAVEAFQEQSSLLERLLSEEPNDTQCRLRLGESLSSRAHVLRDMGKTQQAREAYRKAAKLEEEVSAALPADPSRQASLANIFLNYATVLSPASDAQEIERLLARAVELTKSALKANPDSKWYQHNLALCLEGQATAYWNQGQRAQAEEAARASIDIYERLRKVGRLDRWTERYLGRGYKGLGLIVAGRGRFVEADKLYNQAAEILSRLVKDYPDGAHWRGDLVSTRACQARVQEALGNYDKALERYRQGLQIDPKGAHANNCLAWFLATCQEPGARDAREAVRLAKKAIETAPEDGNLWNTLGVAQYRDGDFGGAVESLRKAMTLHCGGDAYDWLFLAMAHWKLGDREEARRWLAKGVESLQKDQSQNEELQRFQTEAKVLLNDSATPVQVSKTSIFD
jgi:serine/threonine protein kinase/tetratricopeptide (TPR) repeat protein